MDSDQFFITKNLAVAFLSLAFFLVAAMTFFMAATSMPWDFVFAGLLSCFLYTAGIFFVLKLEQKSD